MSIDAFPFPGISGSLFVPSFANTYIEEPVINETPGFCLKHGLCNQAAVVNLRSVSASDSLEYDMPCQASLAL
jgi:hypothetical protein